jgi:pimeloyl-ACP methyl ester carboxylesterase
MAAAAVVRHRTVEANGISMHVAESGPDGDGAPAVVFLHGFPELASYSAFHVVGDVVALLDALRIHNKVLPFPSQR